MPNRLPLALLATFVAATSPARAETFHACAGIIETVPAVISTQGTWCLTHDLATDIATGIAIEVVTNNVTIDCNGFKLGGLGAGPNPANLGIHAGNRRKITVRNCNIRGFQNAISLTAGAGIDVGHVVEDNTLDGNTWVGIRVLGDASVVRRNIVVGTGGSIFDEYAAAIDTSGTVDILDNTVSNVMPTQPLDEPTSGDAYGIRTSANLGGSIAGNRVRGIFRNDVPESEAVAIDNRTSGRLVIAGNHVTNPQDDMNTGVGGIHCANALGVDRDNTVIGYFFSREGCTLGPGNYP